MSKFPSLSDIVSTTLRNHSATLADNLIRNNTLLQQNKDRWEWRETWSRAIHNMPWKDKEGSHKAAEQIKALAKCLSVEKRIVKRALSEGNIPSTPELAAKVRQFAGDYGTALAGLRLASIGKIKPYKYWPAP